MPGVNTRGQATAAVTPNKQSKTNSEDSPKSSQRKTSATKEARRRKKGHYKDDDDQKNNSGDETMNLSDDETIQGGSAGRKPKLYMNICTLKLKVTGGENAFGRA